MGKEKERDGRSAQKSPQIGSGCVWSRRFALYKTYISRTVLRDQGRRALQGQEGEKWGFLLVSGSRQTLSRLSPSSRMQDDKVIPIFRHVDDPLVTNQLIHNGKRSRQVTEIDFDRETPVGSAFSTVN